MVLAHLFDKVVEPASGSLIAWLDEVDVQRQANTIDQKAQKYVNELKKASEHKNQNESTEDCMANLGKRSQIFPEKSAEEKAIEKMIEAQALQMQMFDHQDIEHPSPLAPLPQAGEGGSDLATLPSYDVHRKTVKSVVPVAVVIDRENTGVVDKTFLD